ncbi:hypothetical protein [Streptomyces chryseus]|uniref:hypothetical protein n=1 Tax=Streptomyces chryseus TaxID=68186 RepID=UPI001E368AB1|nr:hypothetical protein [Streptomyces chryseus]
MGGGDPRITRRTLDAALALGLCVKINCFLQRTTWMTLSPSPSSPVTCLSPSG